MALQTDPRGQPLTYDLSLGYRFQKSVKRARTEDTEDTEGFLETPCARFLVICAICGFKFGMNGGWHDDLD